MKARLFIACVLGVGLALAATWVVAAQGGWVQSNTSGFGDPRTVGVNTLVPFDGQLYAGTSGDTAQLWRLSASGWTSVMTDGFGSSANWGIDHLIVFSDTVYAGTGSDTDGGEVWRSGDGNTWNRVVAAGFGDVTNGEIMRFAVFRDTLYASTWSYTETHGAEIWRSSTGDSSDWTQVVSNGFDGDTDNMAVLSFEIFSDKLYAGTFNSTTGGEVWRSSDGTNWDQVNADGFGTANNRAVSALAAFSGRLYASTMGISGVGSQVWRCQVCDGSDWSKVVDNGFGDADTRGATALEVLDGHLYLAVRNYVSGLQVWRTADGTTWGQVGFDGFGDSNNWMTYFDNSMAVFDDRLYVGTFNPADGGEIWVYPLYPVYLPLVCGGH